jgi:hypothetical protein
MNFEKIPDIFTKTLSKHEIFAKALFERPESLSKFLPYDEYLPEFSLFRQKDGSLGVVYEVTLCEHETKSSDQVVELLSKLRNWFRLDETLTLSLLFEQSPISPHDAVWNRYATDTDKTRNDVPASLHLAQIEKMKRTMPLKRRLYLSVRSFEKKKPFAGRFKSMQSELANPDQTLSQTMHTFLKEVRVFNHLLSQFELTTPLTMRRLDDEALADILRRTFNPVTYYERPFAKLNSNLPLSDQLIFCPSELKYSGISREGVTSRTITLKNAPSFAYPGAMAYFLSLDFPFRIGINISFPKGAAIKRHFGLKEFFLQNTPSARSRRQKAEIDSLQERLLRDDRVLNMTFCVFIESEARETPEASTEELERRTKETLARFQQKLECEAIVEKEIGFGLWLNSLPLNYHPIADATTKRTVRILASDIILFSPVFDTFRGTDDAQSLFYSRENGVVPFSLKTYGNSHMTAVLGDTGSAKSGQVIKLLLGELRREPTPIIFVIDHKTSYGVVSKFIPSELTTFESGKPMPFSPFRGQLDEDKQRFLVHWLTAAIQLTSPQFNFESEHQTCISQALKFAFEAKARAAGIRYIDGKLVEAESAHEPLVTLDDIMAQLGSLTGMPEFEKYGQAIDEISRKLRPFYSDGIYASFFRQTTPTPKSLPVDLYVYDLDGLSGDPILQTLATMSVVDEIRRKIRTDDARARGGFVVIEELGMLGRNNPVAKDFVIDAAETFRKLGFFLIGLTPNPANYFTTEAGKAMWAVADHYIFLAMKDDNVKFLQEKSDLLDEASAQIVKSLRTIRGRFAECFYIHKSKEFSGAFRSVPSAHELWLMPTHRPDDIEAKRTLAKFPDNPELALDDLVERYPNGTTELPGDEERR